MRNFPPDVAATAQAWFDEPIQTIAVPAIGAFGPTADGAAAVDLPGGMKGFIKPRDHAAESGMVAREKICADLGHVLGLPVAPGVVRRPDPGAGWNHHGFISLVASPSARIWHTPPPLELATLAPQLEALRVLWSWTGDADHNGNAGNLLRVDGGTPSVLSIDHSYTLDHNNPPDPLVIGAAAGYGSAGLVEGAAARREMVERVKSLPWDVVEGLVRRLSEILTVERQDRILAILNARRGALDTRFGL